MSKMVIIGDTHGRAFWKLIVDQNKDTDRIVFLGDYFDTHETISPELQMINFREIAQFAEKENGRVVLLIGNHDEHYFPFMGYSGTSGYQGGAAPAIGHLLMTYKDLLKICHLEENILCTHAGVSDTFLRESGWDESNIARWLTDLWEFRPNTFKFNGIYDSSGDDICQTPIWIRPRSLMKDSEIVKGQKLVQVVGHTTMKKIDIEGKSTGGKYFFIDCLGTSGEYLIIEDGEFKTGKI